MGALGVTAGQGQLNVVFLGSVPSRVATVVIWFMSVLLPDMSSIFITVQIPVGSTSQAIGQLAPWLYVEPGPGSEGTGSA